GGLRRDVHRNADACLRDHQLSAKVVGIGETLDDPLRDQRSFFLAGHSIEQDAKLIAAEASGGVIRPDARTNTPPHLDEQLITDSVPHRIVDALEVIKVDEKYGAQSAFAIRFRSSSGGQYHPEVRLVG